MRRITDLGLMRCVARNTAPSKMQRPPTTRYAMPKNGFLPPITVRVEIKMDLVPLYAMTGKPRDKCEQMNYMMTRVAY
jgi:hypothetical protein